MKLKELIASRKMRIAAGAFGALILALLIFHAGVVYGSHRNPFGRHDAERGFRPSFFPENFELPHGFIPSGHGAVGTVSSVSLPTFTLKTRAGTSQTVSISSSTVIRSRSGIDIKTLSVGNQVIVLGEPNEQENQGSIEATIIRILSDATSTL